MDLLGLLKNLAPETPKTPWTLVAVGNPEFDNLERRRALGRNLLLRWSALHYNEDYPVVRLKGGPLYQPYPGLQVFLPEVRNERLGVACQELLDLGHSRHRMVLVASDLRLTLGTGRLRLSGEMDHPGLRHLAATLKTSQLARLVFGIGPMGKPHPEHREGRWTPEEWEHLPQLEATFSRFVSLLRATSHLSELAPVVNALPFWPAFRRR